MPQVLRDSSLQPGIVNQDKSIFDYPNTPAPSILTLQVPASQPLPERTSTATGLLFPDLLIAQRLANFPEQVYSLDPSSVLVRFMTALMGPAGAGQLRQRQLVARLQSGIQGTHFYDLDAFYGALFSANRTNAAALPQNPATGTTFSPYTDLATADGWDQIHAADAIYRERVIQLARAIALGGTVPGIQAMAEAIVRVPCNVYEVWRLIDYQEPENGAGFTWAQLQAIYPTWATVSGTSWDALMGIVEYGGLGTNVRNEVIIQPQKSYGSSLASQQQAVADADGIFDVVRTLAPAFSIISVDTTGSIVDSPVTIAGAAADSSYWEIISKVTVPNPSTPTPAPVPGTPSVPTAPDPYSGHRGAWDPGGLQDPFLPMKPGVPPFSQSQGGQYSYAGTVAQVFGGSFDPATSSVASVLESDIRNLKNFQVVHQPGGNQVSFEPVLGVIDPVTAAAGRASNPAFFKAAPYSGPRAPVITAG